MKIPTKSYPTFHSLLTIALILFVLAVNKGTTDAKAISKIDVGVILDLGTVAGKMMETCISMALTDYHHSTQNYTSTQLVLHTRDSHGDILDAASSAIDLIKNVQVQAILGPQTSSEAEFVADIGNKTKVPIISFSATSPSISSTKTPYFIRTALNDSTQVKAIAAIVKAFGWRQIVPIYEDTDYGKDIIPYLTDAIQDVDAHVPYRSILSPSSTVVQIQNELNRLKTMQTRVFVVHMTLSLGSRLFSTAKEVGMMTKGYVWIITDGLTDLLSSMDASIVDSMQGVLGVKPYVPKSKSLDNFRKKWKRKIFQENHDIDEADLSVWGLWAFDSVWSLATAIEKVNTISPRFNKPNDSRNSTDLEALGVSQIGPELVESILQTKLNGLSGKFWLKDGQLQSSTFNIVNVIGSKGRRNIGFWSPTLGISRELKVTGKKIYKTYKGDLGAIIWPGETTKEPKGWEKKLKIGVPMKKGFTEFVKITEDPLTNATNVTGFCIDVFKAVIAAMPYAIPYEFVPFVKNNDQSAGNYNTLVHQIYIQEYDAVVGDVTIVEKRSLQVDFTLAFSESGVSMVVPIKNNHRKNEWIFLKPLTRDLWLTIGAFFILTGFVVWVLEHRVNEEFRGKVTEQVGMILYFSFSTLVFAHKERVISNLARFVVIIWIFVVLILTSSYTASLTSMLTIQRQQPTVTDIKALIRNGDFIGYQQDSFVFDLIQSMGIHPSKLIGYATEEEYHVALEKGSRNGGVSAIVDEIPYIKIFLAKYCRKYMMVGPTHRTGGFGFAFPKGSPLAPDISRSILKVTQGEKMNTIDEAWFGKQVCSEQDEESNIFSESLTLEDFKGLFFIAGAASSVAFLIFLSIFLFEHRNILTSEGSISQKLSSLAKQFNNEKHISTRGSKKIYPSSCRTTTKEHIDDAGYDASFPQGPITNVSLRQEDTVLSLEEIMSFPQTEPSMPIQDCTLFIEMTSLN
ncbi:Glutamate receptor 2.2 [Thalictrum thalictroides]|uniref:Glutamate receptor n=1 Tax=Thalictrum thalictroides TaxID=46969 RepID=A0A7J6VVP2_THATH|nr:Glutamate receptor 2.2 [Thalictrum thalictroides]